MMLKSKIIRTQLSSYSVSSNSTPLVHKLKDLFIKHKPEGGILVLTGAGVSTDSGLRDYRGTKGAYVVNPSFKPITYQQFSGDADKRQRYWARSFFGYPRFILSEPNSSHEFLSKLESNGYINHIITQNVDNLHQRAGSKKVLEIHGTLKTVSCLKCKHVIDRIEFQKELARLNTKWENFLQDCIQDDASPPTTPDGDVLLPDKTPYNLFNVPNCPNCSQNFIKPDVVFFGENMTQESRAKSQALAKNAKCILVIGSSLATPSAYRLSLNAAESDRTLAILNLGPTRSDSVCDLKIDHSCSEVLSQLVKELKLV